MSAVIVPVPMMNIRKMGMTVAQPFMRMVMRMRFLSIPWKRMLVLMMLIVSMRMHVLQRLMNVLVLM